MALPTVRCIEATCRAEFIYVQNRSNPEKITTVPVDVDSFSQEELRQMTTSGSSKGIHFDGARHVSHFKTCTNPRRFSRRRER